MKTKSIWGQAGSRFYRFVEKVNKEKGNNSSVCIVGASDGKFVFPFLRKGFNVTAIEIDKIAIYGGDKEIPVERNRITKKEYVESQEKPVYRKLETKSVNILGLIKRSQIEGYDDKLNVEQVDFYKDYLPKEYDVVFTSCSIQYKGNRDIPVENMIEKLKSCVAVNGFFYMDYMMPLEEEHTWKAECFLRNNQIKKYFDEDSWIIHYVREMKKPIMELAHADRPEDHYHRFGYIFVQRKK